MGGISLKNMLALFWVPKTVSKQVLQYYCNKFLKYCLIFTEHTSRFSRPFDTFYYKILYFKLFFVKNYEYIDIDAWFDYGYCSFWTLRFKVTKYNLNHFCLLSSLAFLQVCRSWLSEVVERNPTSKNLPRRLYHEIGTGINNSDSSSLNANCTTFSRFYDSEIVFLSRL